MTTLYRAKRGPEGTLPPGTNERIVKATKSRTAWLEATDLVGVTEAASILGIPKTRIYRLQASGEMPEPVVKLDAGQFWARADVTRLRDKRRRKQRDRAAAKTEGGSDGG